MNMMMKRKMQAMHLRNLKESRSLQKTMGQKTKGKKKSLLIQIKMTVKRMMIKVPMEIKEIKR